MQTPYNLPNGDAAMVVDTATAGESLGRAVQLWREGATEPLFYGSEGRPEGVVISFDQWAEYEAIKLEADFDGRVEDTTREPRPFQVQGTLTSAGSASAQAASVL
jgi:hypothetical protein